MDRRWAEALTAAGLLTAATAAHPGSPEKLPAVSTELEPITVTPRTIPLDESRRRLREMMKDAYCDGCPPLIDADRTSVYTRAYYGVGAVLSFFTGMPEHPPESTPEERAEARIANDWRKYERDPER